MSKIIREVGGIKLTLDECGLYQLTDGENQSKKTGSYGGGYYKQLNDEDFVKEAKEEIEEQ